MTPKTSHHDHFPRITCLAFWAFHILLSRCIAVANILVVGSMNADTFLPVARLPTEGENIMLVPGKQPIVDVPGGKGCTQAVAVAKLSLRDKDISVSFAGQFGNDEAAKMLRDTLTSHYVKVPALCTTHHQDLPSGRGYVFLTESGQVSAVVSGGSNEGGWKRWERTWDLQQSASPELDKNDLEILSEEDLDKLLDGVKCIMLQREVRTF